MKEVYYIRLVESYGKQVRIGGALTHAAGMTPVKSQDVTMGNQTFALADVSEENKVIRQYGKTTLARYKSIFIGGIAHERGHAISMPHNVERPDQAGWGRALMGSGNRTYGEEFRTVEIDESKGKGSFLTLADALRLASHPSFSGSVKGFDEKANAKFSDAKISTTGKDITYSARVVSDPPTYAVIAYFDPAGGNDYDATTASAVPDANGNFSFKTTALPPGKSGELRVVALQANGAASSGASNGGTTPVYPYDVRADGTVDLSLWTTSQQLAPLADAVQANDLAAAERALQKLQVDKAPANLIEIARVQLANFGKTERARPNAIAGNSLWLSEAAPTSASVGWLVPAYDRLPAEMNNPLLAAGGKFYARGIYAHAPASHVYDLGAKWNRLRGVAGGPAGKSPTVAFVILGDGKELWRQKIEADQTAPFDVSVAGVQKLELRVEDGGNENGQDWAVWFDPLLTR